MTTGIYQIVNETNGKKYIGSSINIESRYKRHISYLRNCIHPNKKLQNAVNKYGLDKFHLKILEVCESDELLIIEQEHIDAADPKTLYNLTFITTGGGSDVQRTPTVILDLNGRIVEVFNSQSEAARYFEVPQGNLSGINTDAVFLKYYRVVTKDFYDKHLDTVYSWFTE